MSKKQENFLDKIPVCNPKINFSVGDDGIVTLEIENKGLFNRIAQKLFKKPKVSFVHLDENGSFIWLLIDGERDVCEIGKLVEEHFGEKANPLYERLTKYLSILQSYGFITFKK